MDSKEFKEMWKSKFPNSDPIGYTLKWNLEEKWFRIHSLPNSKRYAETKEEYEIVFKRQNEIISDIIGNNEEIILSFGLYIDDWKTSNYKEITDFGKFTKVDKIDLREVFHQEYQEEVFYEIYIMKSIWLKNKRNDILKAIADDEIRIMFICPKKKRIIIPYDGGVDVILENEEIRDKFKEKYKNWLSNHPEGL